jgi:predicted metal-dependent peptidase
VDPVEASIVRLLRAQPFFASLVMGLRRSSPAEARRLTPTACVFARKDGTIGLAVNEDFLARLAPAEQDAVLVHECLHVVNLHLLRGPKDFPRHEIANIAMDLAINQFIKGLPEGALALSDFPELKLAAEETADYYYARLTDGIEDLLQRAGGLPRPLDDHDKFGTMVGSGEAGGEPTIERNPSRALVEAAAQAVLADAVRQAKASNTWGTVPAGIARAIDRALTPRVDWRRELRRFVGDRVKISTTGTRKKPNRRFGWDFPGKKALRAARVLIAIDTSGSIGDPELSQFLAEIEAVAAKADVIVAEVDAAVQDVYAWKRGRTHPALRGGGGTSFQVVWDAIAGRSHALLRSEPDGIVYLTDGYGDWPRSDAGIPTLWVLTTPAKVREVPFGKGVHLEIGRRPGAPTW